MSNTTKLDRIRAANLVAEAIKRQLTPGKMRELGAPDEYWLGAELAREPRVLEAAVLAVTAQRELTEVIATELKVRAAVARPWPAAWSPEYERDYTSGWRTAQRTGGNEMAADAAARRRVTHAWHDGFEDYSVGREKWTKRDERLAGDHEPEPPRPGSTEQPPTCTVADQ